MSERQLSRWVGSIPAARPVLRSARWPCSEPCDSRDQRLFEGTCGNTAVLRAPSESDEKITRNGRSR